MKLSTPRWWYRRHGSASPVARFLLTPVSWIWAWETQRRLTRTAPADPGVPVICVGNLTVGGTGKTPVVREILRRLTDAGLQPHGLSRGYGGSLRGPVLVEASHHVAAEVGDEALMLARDAPVWVARDRAAGARAAAAAGAQVVVMDDGHQNPSVRKILSLVVVDGETRDREWPFGEYGVFPAGPMREPLARGLKRADAVVVLLPSDLEAADPELLALFAGTPVLIARLEPLAPPPGGRQIGFAGIGKPWKFERALRAAGCDLVEFFGLPDHRPYDETWLGLVACYGDDVGLVTTEKDWVRLPPQWRDKVTAWPVRARFEDEPALDRLLAAAVRGPAAP